MGTDKSIAEANAVPGGAVFEKLDLPCSGLQYRDLKI